MFRRLNKHLYIRRNGSVGVRSTLSYGTDSVRHKQNILLLMDYLIGCNVPLHIIDNKKFYNFVTFLDPKFNNVSRRTVERNLKEYVENEVCQSYMFFSFF